MNKVSFRIVLSLLLSAGLSACSGDDIDVISGGNNSLTQTRSVYTEQMTVNLSPNPVYVLAEKDDNGIYATTALTEVVSRNLTMLNMTVRLPKAKTLTGISLTAPADKVLCGEFTCNANGIASTSASANHQLFVEFKNAEGENHVDMAAGEGIRFALPVAPVALESGELTIRLHVTGNTIYETTVKRSITPGSVADITLDDFAATQGNRWLALLDDDRPISALSMPGTHDAATGEGTVLSLGVTQSLSMQEQWDMGIRVFDLRPGYKKVRKGFFKYENELHIYHGIVETKVSFDKAIKCLTGNLKANPEEFAIVVMRFENDSPAYNDRNVWNGLMKEYLTSRLPEEFKIDYRPDLTLGDVRGKLLILSRDAYSEKPVTGGFVSGWSHGEGGTVNASITSVNGITAPLNVQDWYNVSDVNTKRNAVCAFIHLSSAAESGRLTINHASGYTGIGSNAGILDNASNTQTAVYRYLTSDERSEGSAGIILMDQVGIHRMCHGFKTYVLYGGLAPQAIINNNFKYKVAK